MSKKQNVTSHNARKTVFGWLKRAFLGASKEYAQEELERYSSNFSGWVDVCKPKEG